MFLVQACRAFGRWRSAAFAHIDTLRWLTANALMPRCERHKRYSVEYLKAAADMHGEEVRNGRRAYIKLQERFSKCLTRVERRNEELEDLGEQIVRKRDDAQIAASLIVKALTELHTAKKLIEHGSKK